MNCSSTSHRSARAQSPVGDRCSQCTRRSRLGARAAFEAAASPVARDFGAARDAGGHGRGRLPGGGAGRPIFPRGWDLRHSPGELSSGTLKAHVRAGVRPGLSVPSGRCSRAGPGPVVPVRWDLAPRIGAILTLDGTREARPVGEMSTRSSLGAFCRSSGTKHGAARADVGVDLRACPERLPGRTWRAPRLTATPTGWPQPDRESRR
jgi:hypothetical protein